MGAEKIKIGGQGDLKLEMPTPPSQVDEFMKMDIPALKKEIQRLDILIQARRQMAEHQDADEFAELQELAQRALDTKLTAESQSNLPL